MVMPKLMGAAPTPEIMAKLPEKKIYSIIKLCGLANNKSRFLKELSRIIAEKHGGKVPGSFEELEALPGVGHKTASVVMSHIFSVPAFPVDTHIHRLAHRWGLSDGSSVSQTEKDLKAAFPKEEWNRRHLQIIYYGREFCPARGHCLEECKICLNLSLSLKKTSTIFGSNCLPDSSKITFTASSCVNAFL